MKTATILPAGLYAINPWRASAAIMLDWVIITACFWCAAHWPVWPVYLAAAVLIARTQLALAVLMHDSAHGTLFPNRRVNDLAGQVFAAAPLMVSMFFYRYGHLQHHRAPMSADDPVALVFRIADYPVTRRELAWRLCQDLFGLSCCSSIYDVVAGKHRCLLSAASAGVGQAWLVRATIAASQGLLLGTLWLSGHALLYAGLWLLPAVTLLQLFARVRAITEHAAYPAAADQMSNARTVVRRSWQTFLFGPHCIHYHIEHHCHPRVPFYRLPEVHLAMLPVLPAANLYKGYGSVLRDVTTRTQ